MDTRHWLTTSLLYVCAVMLLLMAMPSYAQQNSPEPGSTPEQELAHHLFVDDVLSRPSDPRWGGWLRGLAGTNAADVDAMSSVLSTYRTRYIHTLAVALECGVTGVISEVRTVLTDFQTKDSLRLAIAMLQSNRADVLAILEREADSIRDESAREWVKKKLAEKNRKGLTTLPTGSDVEAEGASREDKRKSVEQSNRAYR